MDGVHVSKTSLIGDFMHLEHRAITPLRTSSMFSLKSRNKVIFQQVEQFTEFTYKSPGQHWSMFYNHNTLVHLDKRFTLIQNKQV